mmetsp:Transcript_10851/g.32243  ORF Transcript_10851/g.32243 Transcript_10851/m.32243 type:complete len:210 (+) Transcript_10851:851-1480(+)
MRCGAPPHPSWCLHTGGRAAVAPLAGLPLIGGGGSRRRRHSCIRASCPAAQWRSSAASCWRVGWRRSGRCARRAARSAGSATTTTCAPMRPRCCHPAGGAAARAGAWCWRRRYRSRGAVAARPPQRASRWTAALSRSRAVTGQPAAAVAAVAKHAHRRVGAQSAPSGPTSRRPLPPPPLQSSSASPAPRRLDRRRWPTSALTSLSRWTT